METRLWRQRKLRLRLGRTLIRYLEEGPSEEDFLVRAKGRVHGRAGNENAGAVDRLPPVGLPVAPLETSTGGDARAVPKRREARVRCRARRPGSRSILQTQPCPVVNDLKMGQSRRKIVLWTRAPTDIFRSCGAGQKTTTIGNRGGPAERCGSPGGNIRGEVVELTWDSASSRTRDQVFPSHSRTALLSNASPLARRMSREAEPHEQRHPSDSAGRDALSPSPRQ